MRDVIFDKKNVIVLGGAGFLGSHLCERLLADHKVICVDNFSTGSVDNIRFLMQDPNFSFINHDISKPLDFENQTELKDFKADYQGIQEIYNLACPTSAKKFDELKINTLEANSVAMKNILDMAKQYKAKLLHLSSAVVYGSRESESALVSEDHMGIVNHTSPRACYDEGKRFAESMALTYKDVYNMPVKIARIFRTYGPRMPLRDGQMISDFIIDALDNKDLLIYGTEDFTTTLMYVDDAIDALINIMESDKNEIYNVGSDVDYRLTDVANKIINMTSSTSKIVYHEPLEFITALVKPSIDKIKYDLGWVPVTTLEQGLAKTIEYTKANKILVNNDIG